MNFETGSLWPSCAERPHDQPGSSGNGHTVDTNKRNLLELWATQQIDNRRYTSYLAWEADREKVMDVYLQQAKSMADVVYLREFLRNAGKAVAQHLTRIHEQRVQDLETQLEMLNATNHSFAEERRFLLNAQEGLKAKFAADKADLVSRLEAATSHIMEQRRQLESFAARGAQGPLPPMPPELENLKREAEAAPVGRPRAGFLSDTGVDNEMVGLPHSGSSRGPPAGGAVIGRVSEEGELRELRTALKASEAEKRQLEEKFDRDVGMLRTAIERAESERSAMVLRADDLDQRRARAELEAEKLRAALERAAESGAAAASSVTVGWGVFGARPVSPPAGPGVEELRSMRARVVEARREVAMLEEVARTLSAEVERLVAERAAVGGALEVALREAAALAAAVEEHGAEAERVRGELQAARVERDELARRADLLTHEADVALQAAQSQIDELGERAATLATGSARKGKREAALMRECGQLRHEAEAARATQQATEGKLSAVMTALAGMEASEKGAREDVWRLEEEGRELNRHLLAVNREAEALKEQLRNAEMARDVADAERLALRSQLRSAGLAPAALAPGGEGEAEAAIPVASPARRVVRALRPSASAERRQPAAAPEEEGAKALAKRGRDAAQQSPHGGRAAQDAPDTPPLMAPLPPPADPHAALQRQAEAAAAAAAAAEEEAALLRGRAEAAERRADEAEKRLRSAEERGAAVARERAALSDAKAALELERASLQQELERRRVESELAKASLAAAQAAAGADPELQAVVTEAEARDAAGARAAGELAAGALEGELAVTGPEQQLELEVARLQDRVAELLEDRDGYMREIDSLEDGLVDRDLRLAEAHAMADAQLNAASEQIALLKSRIEQLEALVPLGARGVPLPAEDPRSPSITRSGVKARPAAAAARAAAAAPRVAPAGRAAAAGGRPGARCGVASKKRPPSPTQYARYADQRGEGLRASGGSREADGSPSRLSTATGATRADTALSSDSLDAMLDIAREVVPGPVLGSPAGHWGPLRCESPSLPKRESGGPVISASLSPLGSPSKPHHSPLSDEQRASAPPTRLRLPAARKP